MNVLISLGSALLGALFSWLILEPYRLPNWIDLYSRSNLRGRWCCAWQSDIKNSGHWTYDTVTLRNRLGKLRIEVLESSDNYNWAATLRFEKPYFRGFWDSRRPSAIARGTMMVKLSAQGEFLAGHWIGPTNDPRLLTGRMIIASTRSKIEQLKLDFAKYI